MNNVYISSTPKHDIRTELNEVHKNMINKYKLQQNAFKDKERAEIMTKYLQAFIVWRLTNRIYKGTIITLS